MTETDYKRADAVLCFENFKDAALYFERVLPLNMGRMRGDPEVGDILIGYPEEVPSAALSHLIDGIEGNTQTYSHATRVMELFVGRWTEFARKAEPYVVLWGSSPGGDDPGETSSKYEKLRNAYFANKRLHGHPSIRSIFHEYARSLGFDEVCVAVPAGNGAVSGSGDPSLTLSQLQLVDTSGADWRQIIEVRKDKDSHQRLTRLRLFMHANYSGKPFAFIEDDLSMRLDQYDAAAKKHGLQTTLSSLTVLLNAKDLQASAGAGLVAALFGGAVAGIGTALAVEVGKVAVHIAERKHEMEDWHSGHELAYIFGARSAVEGSK